MSVITSAVAAPLDNNTSPTRNAKSKTSVMAASPVNTGTGSVGNRDGAANWAVLGSFPRALAGRGR